MSQLATSVAARSRGHALAFLTLYSLIGLFVFFAPIEIAGRSTIPLDHAASAIATHARPLALIFVCLLILYGAVAPIRDGSWRRDLTSKVFTVLKLIGVAATAVYLSGIGPAALFAPDMLPFLFDKLVITVGLIVPIGALALGFLVGFGLLELVGVLVDRIMRPVWRTPGWSAIDAVASFVGSYSLALLITDRVFRDGKYSVREAAIIATGFSTVSATFMVVVAKTLGLMDVWNLYFWSTLVVTFLVTAITARLWPIAGMRHIDRPEAALPPGCSRWQAALDAGLAQTRQAPRLLTVLRVNLLDGVRMAAAILPSIMAVGLLGLLAAKHTPLFDVLGLVLYPFTWIAQLPEPMAAAKAIAAGLAEMFLPAILLTEAAVTTKFVAAVVSVSQVIFLSASVPCILATSIPLGMRDLLVIWLLRTVLSILLAAPIAWLAAQAGWLG
jgi:nucleoside recognition membrane protein YjiH